MTLHSMGKESVCDRERERERERERARGRREGRREDRGRVVAPLRSLLLARDPYSPLTVAVALSHWSQAVCPYATPCLNVCSISLMKLADQML